MSAFPGRSNARSGDVIRSPARGRSGPHFKPKTIGAYSSGDLSVARHGGTEIGQGLSPSVEQGICQLLSSWQPKATHNTHMGAAIRPGFAGDLDGATEGKSVASSLSPHQVAPRRNRPGAECPRKRLHTTLRTPPSPVITILRRFSSDPRARRRCRCGHTTPLRAMPDSDRPAYCNCPQGDTTTHPISNRSTLAAASS